MRKAANVAVNNYARLETDCKKQWNFHNSFFFAGTLATTIGTFLLPISTDKLHSRYQDQRDGEDRLKQQKGYGNNAPATRIGRLFCCFFVIVGLPYFAYMVSVISDLIHSILNIVR